MASRRPTDPSKTTPTKAVSSSSPSAASVATEQKPVAAPVTVPVTPNPGIVSQDAPKRRAAPRKKTAVGSPALARVEVSPDVRRSMIAQSAYLRAERRGFAAGGEEADWLAAEAEVDALLKAEHKGGSQ